MVENTEVSVFGDEGERCPAKPEGRGGGAWGMETHNRRLVWSDGEGKAPSRRPCPEGVKGRLKVRGVVGEKEDVIRVHQKGDPGGRPGAQTNTGGGSAHSGSGAVDEDVEKKWGKDASLANPVGVLPRVGEGLGKPDSRAWAAIEVVQEEPESAGDPSAVEAHQSGVPPSHIVRLADIDESGPSTSRPAQT